MQNHQNNGFVLDVNADFCAKSKFSFIIQWTPWSSILLARSKISTMVKKNVSNRRAAGEGGRIAFFRSGVGLFDLIWKWDIHSRKVSMNSKLHFTSLQVLALVASCKIPLDCVFFSARITSIYLLQSHRGRANLRNAIFMQTTLTDKGVNIKRKALWADSAD